MVSGRATYRDVLAFALRASPIWFPTSLVSAALSAGLGVAGTIVIGALVGAIPTAVDAGGVTPELSRLLTLTILILAGGAVLGGLGNILYVLLSTDAEVARHHRVNAAASRPAGLAFVESPEFAVKVDLALGESTVSPPSMAVHGAGQLLALVITIGGSGAILLRYRWWAPALALGGLAVQWRWLMHEIDQLFGPYNEAGPGVRRAHYYRDLALAPSAAKEIRIFGLRHWAVGGFVEGWRTAMQIVMDARRGLRAETIVATVVLGTANAVLLFSLAKDAVDGRVSLGQLATFMAAAMVINVQGNDLTNGIYMYRRGAGTVGHLLRLEEDAAEHAEVVSGSTRPAPDAPTSEIVLDGVTFRYPGQSHDVLTNLHLDIPAGRTLAIVGENGAGKTTLVKLLAKLYDPIEGRILVDGRDLRDLDLDAWRRRVGVIFQDFVQYPLSLRHNVAFGAVHRADDDEAIVRALREAGGAELAELGLDTLLTRQFEGGTDLSGGQWQRVALARAMYAAQDGGLLILDEPTANLDVRVEAEIFARLADAPSDVTTILVSHRFSSVRRADRIVVLDGGQIVEVGTHQELLSLDGHYARMYRVQAARFVEQP